MPTSSPVGTAENIPVRSAGQALAHALSIITPEHRRNPPLVLESLQYIVQTGNRDIVHHQLVDQLPSALGGDIPSECLPLEHEACIVAFHEGPCLCGHLPGCAGEGGVRFVVRDETE